MPSEIAEDRGGHGAHGALPHQALGCRVSIGPGQSQAIGFPVIADIFIESQTGQIMELAHRVAEYDNVTYVACSGGATSPSGRGARLPRIYAFVTNVIAALPGVRRTSTSFVPMIIKDVAVVTAGVSIHRTAADSPAACYRQRSGQVYAIHW